MQVGDLLFILITISLKIVFPTYNIGVFKL